MDVYDELVRERREGRCCALVTIVNVVGSIPSRASAKMLVHEDGSIVGTIGGGAAEGRAIAAAREVIATDKPQMVSFNLHENPALDIGMVCGGSLDIFIEPIRPAPIAYLFGAGHVGHIVARLVHLIGPDVIVIDDRPEFANKERFPDAREVHAGELDAIKDRLKPDSRSLIFIATRGHELDGQALGWALGTAAGYIGMIGSRRKIDTIRRKLLARGVTPEQFARVHAPVGLDIGADTPEEIAIAVVAEMIAHMRNCGTVRPLERIMSERVPLRAVGPKSDEDVLGAA